MRLLQWAAFTAAAIVCAPPGTPSKASSHSDAPLIKLDPQANLTDVYAFIRTRPNGQKVLGCRGERSAFQPNPVTASRTKPSPTMRFTASI